MSDWTQTNQTSNPPPSAAPGTADALFQRAESAFNERKFDEASALYCQLRDAGIFPGLMLLRLGMIANCREDFDRSWDLHLRAVAVDPALASKITPPTYSHHQVVCRTHYDTEAVPECPVCGSREQAPMMVVNLLTCRVYHASFHPVRRWVQCQTCGHGFANPRPSAAAYQQAFQDATPEHLSKIEYAQITTYSTIVRRLWQRRPGGDFLDIGGAHGGLAGVAIDFGYRVCALDIHPGYQDSVRRLGVEFLLGDVSSYDFAGRQFDVVAMGDVIEHVADPRRVLSNVLSALKPDGLIWLSTPNYEGTWTRYLREKDAMWLEGEHLQYFSLRSLRRLLADQGLRIIDFWHSIRFIGCIEAIIARDQEVASKDH